MWEYSRKIPGKFTARMFRERPCCCERVGLAASFIREQRQTPENVRAQFSRAHV